MTRIITALVLALTILSGCEREPDPVWPSDAPVNMECFHRERGECQFNREGACPEAAQLCVYHPQPTFCITECRREHCDNPDMQREANVFQFQHICWDVCVNLCRTGEYSPR